MKKTLVIVGLSALAFTACKKNKKTACGINSSYLKDVVWKHKTGALADLKFASTGIYYEDNTNDGNWSLINNCDSIYVTRPSNNFYVKIKSLTATDLILVNPVFGEVPYYK